jgi:hypothetical protein
MSKRHSGRAREAVTSAAAEYEAVLHKLEQADAGKEALTTAAGREKLASLIRELTDLEAGAPAHIAEALQSMSYAPKP